MLWKQFKKFLVVNSLKTISQNFLASFAEELVIIYKRKTNKKKMQE